MTTITITITIVSSSRARKSVPHIHRSRDSDVHSDNSLRRHTDTDTSSDSVPCSYSDIASHDGDTRTGTPSRSTDDVVRNARSSDTCNNRRRDVRNKPTTDTASNGIGTPGRPTLGTYYTRTRRVYMCTRMKFRYKREYNGTWVSARYDSPSTRCPEPGDGLVLGRPAGIPFRRVSDRSTIRHICTW